MKRNHMFIVGAIVTATLAAVAFSRVLGWIDFFTPAWLAALCVLPLLWLIALKGISGLPSHINAASLALRCLLFILMTLCLAEIQMVFRNDGLAVLYLLDHSASIPEEIAAKELEYVNATVQFKGKKDTAGIVVFGENASVELMPAKELKVGRIYSAIRRGHTDIQRALELATAAFPADARRKIVLITDGNENQGNLVAGIEEAAAARTVVDILPVTYDYPREALVEKVHLPDRISENETFDLRIQVLSLQAGPAELAIYRNGVCVARDKLNLIAGRNTYAVALKIEEPGFYAFTARINAAADTIAENNEASSYVYIQGASRILMVAPAALEVEHLARACREDNLEVDVIAPAELPDSLGHLQNYDAIVLANVGSDELSADQMAMLQADVRDLGVGLVMLGGENSFGAGGYEGTPIEETLPVTMDIRQKKINPKGALVLILHTCEFADGNYWAKQISQNAIDTVSRQDDVGVLIYGNGGEQWLFLPQPASDKKFMYAKIDQAVPGDMPSFEPTIQMARIALSKSDAMVRHIIIISDGDPAGPPVKLMNEVKEAGITISTVAINPHSPRDVDVMKYLAYQTGGRYYFAADPKALPNIFIKEAKVVRRSLIFNKQFQPQLVLPGELTKGIAESEIPPLMAYVATTPKPRVQVPLVSDNENSDPILAYWRYGLGKAVAFTSDASSNWGKHWVAWAKYKKFWTQVIRWAARKREKSNLRMHTRMEGDRGTLIIDAVDERGAFINFLKLNGRIVESDNKGSALDIRQTAPGRYEAEFKSVNAGVSIVNIGYQNPQSGGQGFAATGVSIPYSPEYRTLASNLPLLRRAAAAAGGALLTGNPKVDRIFRSPLPPAATTQPLWGFLLGLALALFLCDVVVRRVVVTREDIAAGLAAMRATFRRRGKSGSHDATMAALLRRKQKTFEEVGAPAKVHSQFKRALDRAAADRRGPVAAPPEVAREAPEPAEPMPAKAAAPKSAGRTETAEDKSYTGRLLAAKRRVEAARRKTAKDDDQKGEER